MMQACILAFKIQFHIFDEEGIRQGIIIIIIPCLIIDLPVLSFSI